jgi:hypothetical protein
MEEELGSAEGERRPPGELFRQGRQGSRELGVRMDRLTSPNPSPLARENAIRVMGSGARRNRSSGEIHEEPSGDAAIEVAIVNFADSAATRSRPTRGSAPTAATPFGGHDDDGRRRETAPCR